MKQPRRSVEIRELVSLIVKFLAVFTLLTLLGTAAFGSIISNSSFRFSRIVKGGIDTDALVVGNSRGVNLLVGAQSDAAFSVFNLAYNGLSTRSAVALTKEFFSHGNKARMVIFEASALQDAGPDCQTKSYWDFFPLLKNTSAGGCPNDIEAQKFFPLTLYNSELFLRASYYLFVQRYGDQNWANNFEMSQSTCTRVRKESDPSLKIAARSDLSDIRSQVANLRGWLKKNEPQTRLIFVLAPYFSSPSTNSAIAAARSGIDDSLGKGNYVDLSTALGDVCDFFADPIHLASKGRGALKPILLSRLEALRH